MTIAAQIQALLSQGYRDWLQNRKEHFAGWIAFWEKIRNPAEASYRLAKELASKGLYEEAKYRYKFTLWRQPNRAAAWYNIACCHLALNEGQEAVDAIRRCLKLTPKDESARFLLATLDNGVHAADFPPHVTPLHQARAEFEARAQDYDHEELVEAGYHGHWDMYDAFVKFCGSEMQHHHVLDVGCGTGLLAPMLSAHCKSLIGVDISSAMLELAEQVTNEDDVPCYNALVEKECVLYLRGAKENSFDVIVAANILNVTGGIQLFLMAAYQALRPGGWLIFSTEQLTDERAKEYVFLPERKRFAHSAHYIRQQVEATGWLPKSLQSVPLYPNVPGWMVALQKPENAS